MIIFAKYWYSLAKRWDSSYGDRFCNHLQILVNLNKKFSLALKTLTTVTVVHTSKLKRHCKFITFPLRVDGRRPWLRP